MKTLTTAALDALTQQAEQSPRLRMNQNLHESLDDPIQRLTIAMEPATYIRPHLHRYTWELLTALRGRFVVLTFDEAGVVTDRQVLGEGAVAIETPACVHHTVLSLDPGAVIFEVKHGPYRPFVEADYASWSAPADTREAASFMEWVKTAQVGERWATA
ncbi:WbuC family cupin fold metalloprotein [Pandoraea nosoerga]|uniref:Protein WbuC n=1 Tax=Pandoraea nosoerga TaxID=2508296 RepID=A0A5E4WZ23_9BURK|nr:MULTISPECIES: WbuC family cupin fold metalloprotein [Pandoraea]MBN4668069.1 WbuC family cupin fold metalloprotein [Pandoraea nosoerga]MBN4676429.1 WbuC family cupin fold metalloprotein [Pandoraea nosoerga]MBN4681467.1 WbuC family cupin fold metalloprotein [Pandoraea nosoerga]MBN4747053.1 WbuC family cupin fold metalloprotein [Pandoraea nosoerga]VVE29470.1 protein WbuC [Pandoraea nosoerga]